MICVFDFAFCWTQCSSVSFWLVTNRHYTFGFVLNYCRFDAENKLLSDGNRESKQMQRQPHVLRCIGVGYDVEGWPCVHS